MKVFGDNRAVDGIDLEVRRGEIFGVLGPNGAGKTTMLSMLATLLAIDGGEAEIFGVDVRRHPHEVRQLLGVTGQYASVDENLTATENLAALRPAARAVAAPRPASGPRPCCASSGSRTPPTGRSRSSPAACAAGSTSRSA